nr:hypothetical protein KitaXyl93_62690 [Kitasatospora sp. Xyl93]
MAFGGYCWSVGAWSPRSWISAPGSHGSGIALSSERREGITSGIGRNGSRVDPEGADAGW